MFGAEFTFTPYDRIGPSLEDDLQPIPLMSSSFGPQNTVEEATLANILWKLQDSPALITNSRRLALSSPGFGRVRLRLFIFW